VCESCRGCLAWGRSCKTRLLVMFDTRQNNVYQRMCFGGVRFYILPNRMLQAGTWWRDDLAVPQSSSRSSEAQSIHCMGGYMTADRGQGTVQRDLGDMGLGALGSGRPGGWEGSPVQMYIGTLASSEKTRPCRRPSLWLVWIGGRGKRAGGDIEAWCLLAVPVDEWALTVSKRD
jgi:hypothetical protein